MTARDGIGFTPGPWRLAERGLGRREIPTVYATDTDLRYVAFCDDRITFGEPTNNLANARLIAAAPDLYDVGGGR